MSTVVAPLAYTGSIGLWALMATAQTLIIEQYDYYQKQTHRNRAYIHGANGKLMLSIPIKHLGEIGHQHYHTVEIENSFGWQKQHWKSIQSVAMLTATLGPQLTTIEMNHELRVF